MDWFRERGIETWFFPGRASGAKLVRVSAQLYNTKRSIARWRSCSGEAMRGHEPRGIEPRLTAFDTAMVVVSLVIGIGIFRTPAIVAAAAGSTTGASSRPGRSAGW